MKSFARLVLIVGILLICLTLPGFAQPKEDKFVPTVGMGVSLGGVTNGEWIKRGKSYSLFKDKTDFVLILIEFEAGCGA